MTTETQGESSAGDLGEKRGAADGGDASGVESVVCGQCEAEQVPVGRLVRRSQSIKCFGELLDQQLPDMFHRMHARSMEYSATAQGEAHNFSAAAEADLMK